MHIFQKLILAGLLLTSPLLAAGVTVNVEPAAKACTRVHLPRWKAPALPEGALPWNEATKCDLDFRSSDGGVLMGAYCLPRVSKPSAAYSLSRYAVAFGSGHIRKLSDGEWEQAEPYLNFRDSPRKSYPPMKNEDHLIYQGRDFPKSGSKWPYAGEPGRISQDGSFLALNSWDGIAAYPEPLMPGFSHLEGHYYADLYEIATGARVLTVHGEFHGLDPSFFFDRSAWLSKRYYFLPLDEDNPTRNFVVCDVYLARSGAGRH